MDTYVASVRKYVGLDYNHLRFSIYALRRTSVKVRTCPNYTTREARRDIVKGATHLELLDADRGGDGGDVGGEVCIQVVRVDVRTHLTVLAANLLAALVRGGHCEYDETVDAACGDADLESCFAGRR